MDRPEEAWEYPQAKTSCVCLDLASGLQLPLIVLLALVTQLNSASDTPYNKWLFGIKPGAMLLKLDP